MANGLTFQVIGLSGWQDDLRRVVQQAQLNLAVAARTSALAVQARAREHAPKRTGDLANAIGVEGSGTQYVVGVLDERLASRGGERVKVGRKGRLVGAVNSAHTNPSVYGVWYELGFRHRNIAAHPFMGPAADEERPHFDAAVDQALESALG